MHTGEGVRAAHVRTANQRSVDSLANMGILVVVATDSSFTCTVLMKECCVNGVSLPIDQDTGLGSCM
jgi:hypothetical protein